MEKIENCRPGDKLQVIFHNERGTVNLSIRVSEINVRKEHLRILALNDINTELDEKEIDSWIRLTRILMAGKFNHPFYERFHVEQ